MASTIDIFNAGGLKRDELVGEKGFYNNEAEIISSSLAQEKFIPNIDYADPANFVKFGSAKEYYGSAINHISNNYPYDSSATEKFKWISSLSSLEYHIFQNEIARSVGSIKLTASQNIQTYSNVTEPIEDAMNTYNSGDNTLYITYIDFNDGMTFEAWMKFDNANPTNILTINALSESSGVYSTVALLNLSASAGAFGISDSTWTYTLTGSVDYANWHHYAFRVSTETVDLFIDGQFVSTQTVSLNENRKKSKFVPLGLVIIKLTQLIPVPPSYGNTPVFTIGGNNTIYLDEIRFWEGFRSNEKIGRFWFTHVDGNEK
jgi:hypothetical protein